MFAIAISSFNCNTLNSAEPIATDNMPHGHTNEERSKEIAWWQKRRCKFFFFLILFGSTLWNFCYSRKETYRFMNWHLSEFYQMLRIRKLPCWIIFGGHDLTFNRISNCYRRIDSSSDSFETWANQLSVSLTLLETLLLYTYSIKSALVCMRDRFEVRVHTWTKRDVGRAIGAILDRTESNYRGY